MINYIKAEIYRTFSSKTIYTMNSALKASNSMIFLLGRV